MVVKRWGLWRQGGCRIVLRGVSGVLGHHGAICHDLFMRSSLLVGGRG